MKKKWALILLVLLFITPSLIAEVSPSSVLNPEVFNLQNSYLVSSADSVKFIAKSFFYIIVFFGLIFIVMRYVLPHNAGLLGLKGFKVLRKLPLEVQAALYLAQVGEKYFLLGVGGKQITMLQELEEKDIEEILAGLRERASFEPFKDQLAKLIKRKEK